MKKPDNIECLLYDSSSGKCQLIYFNKKQNIDWCGSGKGEEKEGFTKEHEKLWKRIGFFIILSVVPVSQLHAQGRLHPVTLCVNLFCIHCTLIK